MTFHKNCHLHEMPNLISWKKLENYFKMSSPEFFPNMHSYALRCLNNLKILPSFCKGRQLLETGVSLPVHEAFQRMGGGVVVVGGEGGGSVGGASLKGKNLLPEGVFPLKVHTFP